MSNQKFKISVKATIPIETIKNIPALFGEVDLFQKSPSTASGVSVGKARVPEGYLSEVGSADQNLIQIDGAPVNINASQLFGFFSVLIPDALKSRR